MAKIIFSREAHAAKNIVANLGLSLVSVRLSLSFFICSLMATRSVPLSLPPKKAIKIRNFLFLAEKPSKI
jgi:hypothetical protein